MAVAVKGAPPKRPIHPAFLNAFAFALQDLPGSTVKLLKREFRFVIHHRADDLRHARHAMHPNAFYRHERVRRRPDAPVRHRDQVSALARSVPNPSSVFAIISSWSIGNLV